MEHWPLILAGPIVRRVEPGLVAVWVALKEARSVRLSLWQGTTGAGTGDGLFAGPAPLATGDAATIRVGERLHVAVVTVSPSPALGAGLTYAYNLSFGPPGAAFTASEDLKSLGLLRDQAPSGSGVTAKPRQVALGYETNQLPTFVLPPPDVAGLRIAHGSCRRPHADVADMLPALDKLIKDGRGAIERRPQQLFLTGDQIYADDVAPGLLHLLTSIGHELLGGEVEQLPTRWSLPPEVPGVRLEPAVRSRFPAGLRKPVVMDDARMTTIDGGSHLLALGEFLAMHVLCWSNALWPATLPAYSDVYWRETLPATEFDEVLAGIGLPPDIWRLLTGLGAKTNHGIKRRYPDTAELTDLTATNVAKVLKKIAEDKDAAAAYAEQMEVVKAFRDGLPEARRALANVATYMIFDDHEVTDDWNLTQVWKDRVFTAPLGRTVLRNGLVAYALCQGWGNDPKKFSSAGSPQQKLLDAIPKLFAAGELLPPATAISDVVDGLLGLDGGDPPVRWNYLVDGPKHRVLVLDVRTRRAYRGRVSPPSNLSPAALNEQIPTGPLPSGLDVLFLVSPLPVFALPIIDEIGGALAYRAFDAIHHAEIAGMPGTNPDAVEAWIQDPLTFEALLKRLAPYRKVIVLSGDVHYAHSGEASYWTKAEQPPTRIAQFTSSGLKNAWPHEVMTLSRSFAFTQALERLASPVELLGWDKDSPAPLRFPSGVDVLPPGRSRLRRTPVLLPTHGWPEGTRIERQPDWRWRFTLSRDGRPVAELPEIARPAALVEGQPATDATASIEGYRQVAVRHARQLTKVGHTRQVLFESNVGVVSFERAAGRLTARHELHARPEGATEPAIFTLHTVVLERATNDPAEERPSIGATP